MLKKQIRTSMRALNRAVTPACRAAASAQILAAVEATEPFRRARCVALFASLPDEPDLSAALTRWATDGRRLVLPRVAGEEMDFYDFDPATLAAGAFGIAEPAPDVPRCRPEEIDVVIVPGVAFTAAGARLGRGRGYYDRYLSLPTFRAYKIGVCYPHQLVAVLPVEEHDVLMDTVLCGAK